MWKAVQFQTIQFSVGTLFSSIWPIDRILSGATTLGQNGPGSDSNEGALRIPQSSSLTNILFSVVIRTLVEGGSYPSAEKQLVYFTAPAKWIKGMNEHNEKT